MNVQFFTFNKKYNNTLRPDLETGDTFECLLKSSSSVISPTIELNFGLLVNPSPYNYAYIPDYQRYYWVSEWTFINSTWVASLDVDVLATWRPYIGSTDMYIYRASNEHNGSLSDMKYPVTSDITYYSDTLKGTSSYHAYTFSEGTYVVGIYGENSGSGSISYYGFSATNYASFVNNLFTNVLGDNSIWSEIGKGIRNSIFDISSFIKSCKWFPVSYSTLSTTTYPVVSSIHTGTISISCTAKFMGTGGTISIPVPNTPYVYTLHKHPQASTRGKYCNVKPFSRYKLVVLPFGSFELDTVLLANRNYVLLSANADLVTGMGVLSVHAGNSITPSSTDVLVLTSTCNYAIDIPISASNTNLGGAVRSVGQALFGEGALGLFTGAVKTATELVSPNLDTVVNGGGGLALFNYADNGLYTTFYQITAEDNGSNGRPLYAIRKPEDLEGYIEGESNDFSCPATESELEELRRFINNGFFYE